MRRLALPALGAGVLALSACGSQAKKATVGSAPAQTPTATQPATTSAPRSSSPASAPPTGSASGGSEAPATTRSAPEPAFTAQPQQSEGAAAAAAKVRALGFTPVSTSDYHPSQTLRVLIGSRSQPSGGTSEHAFFFIDGRYIGTDASTPSARLRVVSQGDTEVTLAYALYRPSDSLCCPGAGQAQVHFQLDNGKLAALDPLPSASSSTGTSRR